MDFNDMPVLMLAKMYKNSMLQQEYLLREFNITVPQMICLTIIYRSEEEIRLANLVELLEVDKSNVTRNIKHLENKGYIIRDISKPGERKFRLLLSEKGKRAAYILWKKQKDAKEKTFKNFNVEERQVIARFFEIMINEKDCF